MKLGFSMRTALICALAALACLILSDWVMSGVLAGPAQKIAKGLFVSLGLGILIYFLILRNEKGGQVVAEIPKQESISYLQILENAAEGVVTVSEEGVIKYVNTRIEKMFGYSRDELLGKQVEMLIPMPYREVHIGHRKKYSSEPHFRLMGQGINLFACRKNGDEFPVEIGLSYSQSEQGVDITALVSDITERKQAEKQLDAEREKVQKYLDIAGVMLLILDSSGRVQMINRKGCEILGYQENEVIGKDWFSNFLTNKDRGVAKSVFGQLMAGEIEPVEYFENSIVIRGGRERVIVWHNTVLREDNGKINGTLSSGEDVTDRRRAEEDARLQQQKLIQADKMATLGILVSGVAHEINNPNNFILLNGNILSKVWKDITPILKEHYDKHGEFALAGMPYTRAREKLGSLIADIPRGSRRIQTIVQNLKDFARQDPGDLNQEVNVNSVVESAIMLVGNLIKKSTDNFSVNYGENIPPVRGNFQNLEQVVINLMTNACQALSSRRNGLSVLTGYDNKAHRVIIRVDDEGEGILPENLERIMDPFFTTKRDTGGTGLGLSICYNVVKDHGGELSITSTVERGTSAVISLPVEKKNIKPEIKVETN